MAKRLPARAAKKKWLDENPREKVEPVISPSRFHPKTAQDIVELLIAFNDNVELLEDGRLKFYQFRHKGALYKPDIYVDSDFSLHFLDGIRGAAAIHVRNGYSVYGTFMHPNKLHIKDTDKLSKEEMFFQYSLVEDTNDYTAEDCALISEQITIFREKMKVGKPICRVQTN